MEYVFALAAMAAVNILGAMSPGPAFVYQARLSAAYARRAGVFSALGMGVGAVFWAGLCMLGFAILVREASEVYTVLRLMGGAYLVYLGVALWRQARVPLSEIAGFARGAMADAAAFRGGLFTALSNPKMAAYFGSVFVAVLPPEPPLWFTLVACVSVFLIEFVWYVVVATVFSTAPARRAYGRFKQWIDRVAGGVIAALGVGIMVPGR